MNKLRKGDLVKVVAGKDKSKQGKIVQIIPEMQKVVVEGCNKMIKQLRPKKQREKGQKVEFDAPLAISNVQIICPKCNKITRIGFRKESSGKKIRICRKCKEII